VSGGGRLDRHGDEASEGSGIDAGLSVRIGQGVSMAERKSIFLHSPEVEQYNYPDECPFNTRRAGLTRKTIYSMGLLSGGDREEVAPIKAGRAELEMFHTARYLNAIQKAENGDLTSEAFAMGLGTPDCPVFRGMYDYVSLASGASITGARRILSGDAWIAFNPSGGLHHAFPEKAAGFCYINDIVLACMVLAEAGRRVLFLDLDVHHCDGVQAAFYARKDVMTVSLHESGKTLFPGTGFEDEIGEGEGKGYSANVPLPVGTYDSAYHMAFDQVALPLLKAFNPDVIVLELGMDTLAGDPLAHLHLTNNVYVDIVGDILKLDKPMLVTGGGGYHVENTVRAWSLLWSVLCGDKLDDMSIGMGGVMLGNTDWAGGLRDRVLISDAGRRDAVDTEIKATIDRVRQNVFPYHGL
jgi:acetoin utilization protein AcuC